MNITDEDIFKYVFNPTSLTKEKYDYIMMNLNKYEKEISLCREFNKTGELLSDDDYLSFGGSPKIQLAILYPSFLIGKKENGQKLAAASILTEKPKKTYSFTDAKSNYLIRIVKTESQVLLYLFLNDKTKTKYHIKINPSEAEYDIYDLSQPIEILEENNIESIELT